MTSISSRDVAEGHVAPKTIRVGADVPPGLQINTLTLAEKQRHIAMTGRRLLSREEAAALGFPMVEVDAWFGPAAADAEVMQP